MKRPILIFTVIYILIIAGAQYFKISICAPFNYEKIYSTVSNCQIKGIIVEEQQVTEKYYKYIVKVQELKVSNNSIKGIKGSKIILKIEKGNIKYQIGNEILFNCCIELPEGQRNYGGSDYRLYLKSIGIYATSKISEKDCIIISKNKLSFVDTEIYKIKSKIKFNIMELLSDETEGICIGIILGDTKFISDDVKNDYENSNLLHLLAISGAHISYILLGAEKCLKKIDKRFQKIILIIFLIFFVKLTGSTSSVMRAGLMGIIMLESWLFRRKSDVLNNIAISALIVMIINPYSIYNLGFQLSYGGTIGIVVFYDSIYKIASKYEKLLIQKWPILSKIIKYISTTISVSISANIIITPILMYNTNKISFVFLLSNLLVSFLFGIILILSFLMSSISLISINMAKIIVPILQILIKLLNNTSSLSARFARFDVVIPTPSALTMICIYAIIFLLKNSVSIKEKCKKIIKFILVLYLCISLITFLYQKSNNDFRIFFIDVGQGDSTLIITQQNKKILIDGGGSNIDYDVGEEILLPYLLDRHVMTLDYVMISHFDSDHCKGVFTVLKKLKVKNIIISSRGQESGNYTEFLEIIKNKKINILNVKAGDVIKIDNYTFLEILWPADDLISENIINNYSLIFKLNYKNYSMIFTGDVEAIAEKIILQKYKKQELKSDILKVAHHGSKSSSIEDFINNVSPQIALIGVGENNLFGHPNNGVIDRLNNYGAQVFRTDKDMEIVIIINKKIEIICGKNKFVH